MIASVAIVFVLVVGGGILGVVFHLQAKTIRVLRKEMQEALEKDRKVALKVFDEHFKLMESIGRRIDQLQIFGRGRRL